VIYVLFSKDYTKVYTSNVKDLSTSTPKDSSIHHRRMLDEEYSQWMNVHRQQLTIEETVRLYLQSVSYGNSTMPIPDVPAAQVESKDPTPSQ
jgi:hypothetical protein